MLEKFSKLKCGLLKLSCVLSEVLPWTREQYRDTIRLGAEIVMHIRELAYEAICPQSAARGRNQIGAA
jgi:hypothetical protein